MGTRLVAGDSKKELSEEEIWEIIKNDRPCAGGPIYVRGHRIHICRGLKNSGKINRSILENALHRIDKTNPVDLIVDRLQITVDFKKELGLLRCIQTNFSDLSDIFFAPYRDSDGVLVPNQEGGKMYRRYIRNRKPAKTNLLSVIIEAGPIRVVTAHIGPQSRPLPGMGNATLSDCQWWYNRLSKNGHAFIESEEERICYDKIWRHDHIPWTYPKY